MKILYETQTMFTGPQKLQYTGILKAFNTVWKRDGFLGFWKGNGINLLRIVPDAAIKFASFDLCVFHALCLTLQLQESGASHISYVFKNKDRLFYIFICCRQLKWCFSSVSYVCLFVIPRIIDSRYPLDLTRTRIIVGGKYNGLYHCLSTTLQTEGPRAFYKGKVHVFYHNDNKELYLPW